jgi:hypothetical protein
MSRSLDAFRKIHYPEKNIVLNGGFDNWQWATSITANNSYAADRWKLSNNHTSSVQVAQDSDVPTVYGGNYSMKYTVTTGAATGAAEWAGVRQTIEGYTLRPVIGKIVTLSFWFKSNVTGIRNCSVIDGSTQTHRYTFDFNIPVADTWTPIEHTFEMIDSAPFGFGANAGLTLWFFASVGSSYHGPNSQWVTDSRFGTANANDLSATTNNYFKVADVMLSEGSKYVPFARRNLTFNDEFNECKRYYRGGETAYNIAIYLSANQLHCNVNYDVEMRAVPSITTYYGGTSGVVRSLNIGALPVSSVGALSTPEGFGRIDSAGLFVAGNLYHFSYTANADF